MMWNSFKAFRNLSLCLAVWFSGTAAVYGVGPMLIENEESVGIYRDFDDGLLGRSPYRGVLFSVRVSAFSRYRTLPVIEMDGLTAYLVSEERAAGFLSGDSPLEMELLTQEDPEPTNLKFVYDRDGIRIVFSLETAPAALYEEIERTYSNLPAVARDVSESYESGFIVRIWEAENVYRPYIALLDYEDILISAAFIGDRFQPLWGIHDGNGLMIPEKEENPETLTVP